MKRSKKKSSRVYKKRNDGTSDFELGLALSDDYANSEALTRLAILEKEKKSLEEEIAKLKDCCDERDELRKQIEELNKRIADLEKQLDDLKKSMDALIKCGNEDKNKEIQRLNKEIERLNKKILELQNVITILKRLIDEQNRLMSEKDNKIIEIIEIIHEKDRKIDELKYEKVRACDFLKEIYNKYNNREINLSQFLEYMKNFIEHYCDTDLPRPSTRPRPSAHSAIPRYAESTESSILGYDAAGGKKGRSSDGLKKKRSKKVSRKLKRSSKKKRN